MMKKKLTIGLFNDSFFPFADGVIAVLDNYARRLSEYANVIVFVPSYTGVKYDDSKFPYKVVRCKSIKIPTVEYTLPITKLDMKFNSKVFIFYAILIVGLFVVVSSVLGNIGGGQKLEDYSEVVAMFKNESVKAFKIDETNLLTIQTQDDKMYTYSLRDISIFYTDLAETIEEQRAAGTIVKYEYEPPTAWPWWVSFVPYLILIVIMVSLLVITIII